MSDQESLQQLLNDAKIDVEKLDEWMKSQEPAPGVSYKDWGKVKERQRNESEQAAKAAYPVSPVRL